ncbi:hypothetical protein [Klebsiella phage vB_KpnM-VAC36]|nr:hypothetical protein [Klebsiella phage vB_KpnM-VAC36]WLJ70174.1 hypothetical protein BM7_CDS0245 [Klebsiella phage Kpn BM7]
MIKSLIFIPYGIRNMLHYRSIYNGSVHYY